jgi:hypothetical protein
VAPAEGREDGVGGGRVRADVERSGDLRRMSGKSGKGKHMQTHRLDAVQLAWPAVVDRVRGNEVRHCDRCQPAQ